ncbi:MAG: hypothetical protein LBT03_00945 [Holosporales bacterium]|jgi:putative ABC transport system permease protein|nr:hypothetical protein [Holosporales bacterium]
MISVQEILTSIDIGLIFGIVAVGIYLTFRTINFADLTCDGSFVLGAAVSSVLVKYGTNPYIALFVSLIAGGIIGLCTGILHVKVKISDLLSGIIVAFILYSINLRIMGNAPNITFMDNESVFSGRDTTLTLAGITFFTIAALISLLFSGFGLKLRSTGYNRKFGPIIGINIKSMIIIGLMLSNSMIALGGGLFSQYQGFCDISEGTGTLVSGLASVVIGEKVLQFKKEPLLILSCIVGSIIYRIFINIALNSDVFGIKTSDINLVTGFMIISIIAARRMKKNDCA